MLSLLAAATTFVFVLRIVLAAIVLVAVGFIIFVVMKQSGNTDGVEAMTGSFKSDDESETYYGKNAGSRKEAKLKMWTYIAAGVLAVCCIALVIIGAVL